MQEIEAPSTKKTKLFLWIILAYFFSAIVLIYKVHPPFCYDTVSTLDRILIISALMTIIIVAYIYMYSASFIKAFVINIFYIKHSKIEKNELLSNNKTPELVYFFYSLLAVLILFFNRHTIGLINDISTTYYEPEKREFYFDKQIYHKYRSSNYYIVLKPVKNDPDQFDIELIVSPKKYSNIDTDKNVELTLKKGIIGYVILDKSKIYNKTNTSK